ncbi:hypothetical protein M2263_001319 [Providencia alcalifaciens]|nr:hypothetical protein [Providencia alcalifaciens]
MTLRKTLKQIRDKIEEFQPEEKITGFEVRIVDSSAEGDHLIVGRMYVSVGNPDEKSFTEMYDDGDPRRVKWVKDDEH